MVFCGVFCILNRLMQVKARGGPGGMPKAPQACPAGAKKEISMYPNGLSLHLRVDFNA